MRTPPIALICGSPAAGKTAVAEAIAKFSHAAHIEEDVLFGMRPADRRDSRSQELIVEQMVVLCEFFSRHRYPILIEGLFFDPTIVAQLELRVGLSVVLLLEASLPVCLERNRKRSLAGIQLPDSEVCLLHALPRPSTWRRVPADPPLQYVLETVRSHLQEAGWPA